MNQRFTDQILTTDRVAVTQRETLSYLLEGLTRLTIADPGPGNIRLFAPQLSLETAKELLVAAREPDCQRMYFFGPSVAVAGVVHVYAIAQVAMLETSSAPMIAPLYLYRAYTTTVDYGPVDESKLAAAAYAQEHWGAELRQHSWGHSIRAVCHMPPDAGAMRAPNGLELRDRTVAMACSGDDASPDLWLPGAATDEPVSELLDDTIQLVVEPEHLVAEIIRCSPERWLHYCGLCSGGLLRSGCCSHCSAKYHRMPHDLRMSMPRKLVNYLMANGHSFTYDPLLSRLREHRIWCDTMSSEKLLSHVQATYNKPMRQIEM